MPRVRRTPTHYQIHSLRDGTVTAALPIRKPSARILKRDGIRIDPDGVVTEWSDSGIQYSTTCPIDERIRFLDIFATSLNTKRALRSLVLPRLDALEAELKAVRVQLDRIEAAIAREVAS